MTIEKLDSTEKLVEVVVAGMQNMKAKNIVLIDLTEIENAICKYFVICHGTSKTHASSIADGVKKEVFETLNEKAWNHEGSNNGEWVLLDFSDVVAHVFQEHTREFYNLEDLWADAPIKEFEEL